jgi:uncharacterized Zn-finger protein
MAQPFETIPVDTHKVACDGGGGPLGHPRIYMTIKSGDRSVECPYCSRRYELSKEALATAGGH